jgi:hypothetical protein
VTLLRVAGWDDTATTWDGTIVINNNIVKALIIFTNNTAEDILLVGGTFTTINTSQTCYGIFEYNITTTSYVAVGPGYDTFLTTGADVRAFTKDTAFATLYVGGDFTDGDTITNACTVSMDDSTNVSAYTVGDVVNAILINTASQTTYIYVGLGGSGGLEVNSTPVPSFTDTVLSLTYNDNSYIIIGTSTTPYFYNMKNNELVTVDPITASAGTYPSSANLLRKGASISVIASTTFSNWWVTSALLTEY